MKILLIVAKRGAVDLHRLAGEDFLFNQGVEGALRCLGLLEELCEEDPFWVLEQDIENLCLQGVFTAQFFTLLFELIG